MVSIRLSRLLGKKIRNEGAINYTRNISSLKEFYFLIYRRSSIQDIYFLYRIRWLFLNWLSTCVLIHGKQGPRFERNYIITREQKRYEHGASFQSSSKLNRMLITRLICIQWKFATLDQLADQLVSPSKFCSLRFFLFQRNQRFQGIEFVDQLVLEKLDIFRINLSKAFFTNHVCCRPGAPNDGFLLNAL